MREILTTFLPLMIINSLSLAQLTGPLSGTISAGSYTVIGDISVQEGDSLAIAPGTVFTFEGDYDFDIYGYLNAGGTQSDSIIFRVNPLVSGWGGLDFYSSVNDNSIVQYCHISGSISTGIDGWGNELVISDCAIIDNSGFMGGGICLSNSSTTFENCAIIGNSSSYYGGGISCFGAGPVFRNCYIYDNTVNNNSTAAYGGGAYLSDTGVMFDECVFEDNQAGINAGGMGGGIFSTYSEPTIINCTFYNNSAGQINNGDGGGIYLLESEPIIENCIFNFNSANNLGGGIFCEFSSPQISNCIISNNTAVYEGGGIRIYNSSPEIFRTIISGNTCALDGGGVFCLNTQLSLQNCTICNNTAAAGGGILLDGVNPMIINSIISGNDAGGGINFRSPSGGEISYCDFYDNQSYNFSGMVPAGLGNIITVNINSDSCDRFSNIYLDPMFYSVSGDSAYYLSAGSPCIDAGDLNSPPDPDSTIVDIGAIYYPQTILLMDLIPETLPIQIPANGGSFNFDLHLENNTISPIGFDAWIEVVLPGGGVYGPIILRQGLILSGGAILQREDLTQIVPASAPAGEYLYRGRAGAYPDSVITEDSFPFTKLGICGAGR